MEDLTGLKRWWVVDSNADIINCISKINNKNAARNISTHDFSTLYTSIPHEKLKLALKNIINKTFVATDKKFITVYNKEAQFTSNRSCNKVSFGRQQLIEMVVFLIDNTYFRCGGMIMKQNISIPMGTNPGPDFANLFLHFYEFDLWKKQ